MGIEKNGKKRLFSANFRFLRGKKRKITVIFCFLPRKKAENNRYFPLLEEWFSLAVVIFLGFFHLRYVVIR